MILEVSQKLAPVLTAASVYSAFLVLLSISFIASSNTIKAPNYSIGAIMTVGIYITSIITRSYGVFPYYVFPFTIIFCSSLNWLSYKIVFYPLTCRRRGPVLIMLASIGLQIALTSLLQIAVEWLRTNAGWMTVVAFISMYDFSLGFNVGVFLFSSALIFSLFLFLNFFFFKSMSGLVYLGLLVDEELAMIQGIDLNQVTEIIWLVSGGLAGLAGFIHPLFYHSTVLMGSWVLPSVVASSLIGGFNNIKGAFLGGVLMGYIEILGVVYGMAFFGNWFGEFRQLIPIAVIVITLSYKSRRK